MNTLKYLILLNFSFFVTNLLSQNQFVSNRVFLRIYVQPSSSIYVDSNNISGPWDGTPAHPYRTIGDGLAVAIKGKTVVVQAGTYQITANLTVPDSVTLFMHPKVINRFSTGVGIAVYGKLQAMGTVTDSVLFVPEQAGTQWDGIRFINSNEGSELRFCRIENANGSGEGKGGAIFCSNSSPKLSHCLLQNNQANYGGALFCENGSSPEISYCTITNNTASIGGSGIFSQSATPIVLQNYIINNTCNGLLGGAGIVLTQAENLQSLVEAKQVQPTKNYAKAANFRQIDLTKASMAPRRELLPLGGLISLARKSKNTKEESVQTESIHRPYFGKVPVIEGNTFSQNVCATSGGALALYQDQTIIYDNTFAGNQAMQGGAIYQAQTDSVKIEWNLYETNSADLGGGVFVDGGKANNLARNLFLHNRADFGAGVYLDTTEVDFSHNTLFSNQASNEGGGVYSQDGDNVIKNAIFWDNDSLNAEQISGTGLAVSFCDIEGGHSGAGNIATDPMFVDTTRIGFRLCFQSPCINAGDPNSPQDPDSSRADMGAYYYHRIFSKLALSQDSLQVSLIYEDSLTRFLTLSNIGKNELHWVITDTPNWLTVSPQIGVIAPSASQQLRVEIRTAALRPDQTYHGAIALYSNDESKSDSLIAVTLEVINRFTMVQLNIGTHGYCWGDYDNDGDLDLYGLVSYLNVNEGQGNFSQREFSFPSWPNSATWGDYNNDGYLDLFLVTYSSGPQTPFLYLYLNNGNGTFTRITDGPAVTGQANSESCSWGDYDNDGYLDLFVANSNDHNNFLFHNNRDGTFTQITEGAIVSDGGQSACSVWGDYDNDGDLDLFVTNGMGGGKQNNFLYQNNGNGTFTRIVEGSIVQQEAFSISASWGDYDNDGDLDLFVANNKDANFFYENNGDGTFRRITNSPVAGGSGHSMCSTWGDFDNDGFLDLFVGNDWDTEQYLYMNNGDGTFRKIGYILAWGATSATCADVDGDGDLDIFVMSPAEQIIRFFRNNSNKNSWIDIKCTGTVSNTSAIGTKVRVKATLNGRSLWQMREIVGQTGAHAQNPLNARFGLGQATIVDSIKIEWPSGKVQYGVGLPVNQFLQVREGDGPIVSVELSSFSANLQGKSVVLNWNVSNEMKFAGFEVERKLLLNSKRENGWSKIGSVQGTNYRFVDSFSELISGQYYYRLKLIERDGTFSYSDEINVSVSGPQEFSLSPNYPNPFNPSTTFDYGLPKTSQVVIKIYDVMGHAVRTLIDKKQDAGLYSVTWDGKDENGKLVSTGIYLVSMKAEGFTTIGKSLFLK